MEGAEQLLHLAHSLRKTNDPTVSVCALHMAAVPKWWAGHEHYYCIITTEFWVYVTRPSM